MFLLNFLLFTLPFFPIDDSAQWVYEPAFPDNSSARGTSLVYRQTNPTEKFEARYLRTPTGTHLILSLFWAPIPFQRGVDLQVQYGTGPKQTIQGTLLKGGHKIILPATVSFEIAKTLSLNQNVTFSIQSFETIINPVGFTKGWERFRTFL